MRAYGRVLRHGRASQPFMFAALARLTLAMIPLGILILVEQQRQAYAIAGVVSGAYAIGAAVGTPLWGRLMDRFGQVAVLLPTATASAALLVGLAIGIVISLFQALTQIQEMTLAFVPKILAIFVTMLLVLPFMADLLQSHMTRIASRIIAG